MSTITRTGGLPRLLFTGLTTSLSREVFYNSSRWIIFSRLSSLLSIPSLPKSIQPLTTFTVAFLSGCVGSILANPFDLIRVRQQSEACNRTTTLGGELNNVLSNAKRTGAKRPVLALWNGWQVNCLRAGLFTAGSMTSYKLVKHKLNRHYPESSTTHLAAGGVMGVVGTLMYMPADAVRGRAYNSGKGGTMGSKVRAGGGGKHKAGKGIILGNFVRTGN